MTTSITVKGAREHNLRDVDLTLPRGKLICFSGVSGSGKSSLAFDTLYAEGQRRYVESLSHYARQFMGQMPKPDVDHVGGLSPSISISQKSTGNNPRSTVGTITEIYDFLRVLFARVGTGYCPACDLPITAQTQASIQARVLAIDPEQTLWLLAPLARNQKGEFRDLFEELRRQGFGRARVDGETISLANPPALDRQHRHNIEVLVDQIDPESRDTGRIHEALTQALRMGEGTLIVSATPANAEAAGEAKWDLLFSAKYACGGCGESFQPPSPQLFSFNSPQGMCPGCDGLGQLYTFVPEQLVPDESLSFKKGAVSLLGRWVELSRYRKHVYQGVAKGVEAEFGWAAGTMLDKPWRDLPPEAKKIWLWGIDQSLAFSWKSGSKTQKYTADFDGIIPELVERYRTTKNKLQLRQFEKKMQTLPCVDCGGQRINPQARAVRLTSGSSGFSDSPSKSLPELCELSIARLAEFFGDIRLTETEQRIAGEALKEIRARIGFLLGVGLGYLMLGRTAPTLSGGESQRIRLAGQIGSGLVGVLYILDEPSIGLHPHDNDRLIHTLLRLRDAGNTLIVVEHDEDTMRAADLIVDFGPGPGVRGGFVVAAGDIDAIEASPESVTGQFLSGTREIAIPETLRQPEADRWLTLRGARHNNLKNIDVSVPLGTLVCFTGMSGSGKSSLVGDILEPLLRCRLNGAECEIGAFDSIEGLEHLDKTIAIDQSPIGRTPRSNPATYVKVFDDIRELFAQMSDAKTRGYTASRFSFNVDGGRCAACEGNGAKKLEMDFLADIWVTCPVCAGKRYNRETLAVKFKGHSIADVLELDIAQALTLFENVPKIADTLQTLVDVGLEYLKLGQPSPTLSGGEAQRIKLSRELSRKATGRTLYILDEPTTGLHFADIELLLRVLHGLADRGNTVLVVEHNLDVIKTADWVIDLGPLGGEGGGQIVAEGTPEKIAKSKGSFTGAALAKQLAAHGPDRVGVRARAKAEAARTRKQPDGPVIDSAKWLTIQGAAQHNLKHVDLAIPRDAMTVFCGPSGSGKSSLAMDTIYAEGQRRYVESLSSYARQFIGQAQKPVVERIEGLSPAVALEQKNVGHSPRSTVGTVTEIYDYLRILIARLGVMHCPKCRTPVGTQTPDQIVDKVLAMPKGSRILLMAPIDMEPTAEPGDAWRHLRASGYQRLRIDGKTHPIDSAPPWDPRRQQRVQVVVDRVVVGDDDRSRVSDSVEQALSLSAGVLDVAIADAERDETAWEERRHSQHLVCSGCARSFEALTPHHFSFNSAVGWCPQCDGLGTQRGTNPAALLSSLSATLEQGASLLWPRVEIPVARAMLRGLARATGLPLNVPIEELTVSQRRILFHGTGPEWIEVRATDLDADDAKRVGELGFGDQAARLFRYQFKGFYPALEEASRLMPNLRGKLELFVDEIACSTCDGSRLRDDAAAVRFRECTIGDLVQVPLGRLLTIVRQWELDTRERKIAGELVREIESRLQFLVDVGLEYLTLSRTAATLSGGESQRIRLASQLGSGLCGVLYVLDEPTIGLHPRDNHRLIAAMHRLRDLGNTLLVVEHDRDVIASSDYVCDFGPLAGRGGGRVVAQGPPGKIEPYANSVTAGFLDGQRSIPLPKSRRPVLLDLPTAGQAAGERTAGGQAAGGQARRVAISDGVRRGAQTELTPTLSLFGAKENNLRNVDLHIPLGVLTAVTGPSGSGKSSLINGILYPALARRIHRARLKPGRHDRIDGTRFIDKVIRVDQSPLGNLPSSNPATYTGVFELIRALFASLPDAGERRLTARHFSFNVAAGRCEACQGSGHRRIEMHFLPDVWVECEECRGKRYQPEVLEVKLHGKSISDVLDTPIGDAIELFSDYPKIVHILQTICDVGLDYITLGQSAPTLSGGEAQRIKLAAELCRPDTGRTLYLLDEPTTGLHFNDIIKLMDVLQRLVNLGNSVVVIEHNLDVIKAADWVIDIGPEAGSRGGQIVAQGTPEAVAAQALLARELWREADERASGPESSGTETLPPRSFTGEYLASVLDAALIHAYLAGRGVDYRPSERDLAQPLVRTIGQAVAASVARESVARETVTPAMPAATLAARERLVPQAPAAVGLSMVAETRAPQSASRLAEPPARASESPRPSPTRSAGETASPSVIATTSAMPDASVPWRILGRRWHSLAKGFPDNAKPTWPLEMAELMIKMLAGIAGEERMSYPSADRIEAVEFSSGETWAELRTKELDSLQLTLIGPAKAICLDYLEGLEIDGPIDLSDPQRIRLTMKLTDLKHARSLKLRAFIKHHFERANSEAV
jgi:excinuclease ABC subunit A